MRTNRAKYPRTIKHGPASVRITRTLNRGKESFVVSYVDETRGRVQRRYTEEAKALSDATALAADLARGDYQAVQLSGADRSDLVAAERELSPTGVSIVTAAHTFAEAFALLGGNRILEAVRYFKARADENLPTYTVAEAVARFVAAKDAEGISPKYRKDLRLMLEKGLANAFRCPLSAVSPDELRAYLNGFTCGPVAKNNHRRVIVALFNHAKASGWLRKGEETAAAALAPYSVKEKDVTIYTPAEVGALLAHADADFVPWLSLLAFGGLRSEELAKGLTWDAVNFEKGVLIVPGGISKTGKKRKLEMPENLLAWLAPFRDSAGPIFKQDPDFRIHKTATAAGVPWKRNALRHSFGSYRMESVKNAGQVALEMGNSPSVVLKHYHEIVDSADASRYWAIRPRAPLN